MQVARAIAASATAAILATASVVGTGRPTTMVETSPVGRVESALTADTYVWQGRTRVDLPEDIIGELDTWADSYTEHLDEWADAEPEDAAYYGAQAEGFRYAYRMILGRLGYIDPIETRDTVRDGTDGWIDTPEGREFIAWETASFGELD